MRRFSSRIAWSLIPTDLSLLAQRHTETLLDLTQSNPTTAGIPYPADRILAALNDVRSLRYHPSPLGLPRAREAVSDYYGGRAPAGNILLTASTSEAYSYVFKLLCDPGDQVLVPRPSYPLFDFLAQLEGIAAVQYPMHYSGGWHIDLDALASSVTERTRAIVFVSPNNPTGSYLKSYEYDFLARLGLPLIVDEVFRDYSFSPDHTRVDTVVGGDDVLTFCLSGLSKVSALPQLKAGWIVCGGPENERTEALDRLELIADTFLSISTPVQYALPELLAIRHDVQAAIRQRCTSNLRFVRHALEDSPAQVLEVEGGWYATIQVPRVRSEEEWVIHLIESQGVLVQPGFFFDFESEAFLILSLLTELAAFEEGVRRTILACKG